MSQNNWLAIWYNSNSANEFLSTTSFGIGWKQLDEPVVNYGHASI